MLKIKLLAILDHLRVRHARHRIAEKKLVCAISRKLKNIIKTDPKLKKCVLGTIFDAGAIYGKAVACIYCMHIVHAYIACIYCMYILHVGT